jgi:hypothetical protein
MFQIHSGRNKTNKNVRQSSNRINSQSQSSPTSIVYQADDEKSAVDLIKTYSELERTLDEALNKLDKKLVNEDKKNDLIQNEVDKSCNEIRESYLLDLQSLLHLMLKELEKICNHFIKRMNSKNQKQLKQNETHKMRTKQELSDSVLNTPSSLISSSGADRTELVSYINKTINVIEQTGLNEMEAKHSELVNGINMLLDGRKMNYFQQINDLTVFLAEKLLDSEKKIPDFNQSFEDIKNLPKLTSSFNDQSITIAIPPFSCIHSNIFSVYARDSNARDSNARDSNARDSNARDSNARDSNARDSPRNCPY